MFTRPPSEACSQRGVGTNAGVEPTRQRRESFPVGTVEPGVGPLVEHRAVESLRLAVGLWAVGTGHLVDRTDRGQRRLEVFRDAVVQRSVGHHALDLDAVGGEEARGADQEARAGLAALVGVHLDIGHARVVIDRDVQEVVAVPAVRRACRGSTAHPVAAA